MDDVERIQTANRWSIVIWLLRISCFFVFVGRGWQHLYSGDAPYRALLWDEELLTGTVHTLLGMSWNEYATSERVDGAIQNFIHATGAFYIVCAALSVTVERSHRVSKYILGLGCASLTFLAFLYFKTKFYHIGQFLEYASQFGAPALLIWALSTKRDTIPKAFNVALRLAVALTFICHGLYAFGYYPVPGNFLDMTIQILGVNDAQATFLLKIAGILDFIVGGLLIVGILQPIAYLYAVLWGLATTLARLVANVSWDLFWSDFIQWAPEALHRVPHFTVALAGFFLTAPAITKKIAALLAKRGYLEPVPQTQETA